MNSANSPELLNKQLKSLANIITAPVSHYGDIFKAARDLHELFVSVGAIHSDDKEQQGTASETGYAVSPGEAARCVFDLSPHHKFSRGLIKAIRYKLEENDGKPLHILYAGTGPYAVLAMLAIPYFSPAEIRFTLIDIHEASVDSVNKLIEAFELEDYFDSVNISDATKFEPEQTLCFDMLLTETMQQALRKEQQVSIAAHLVQFLKTAGIMIPEKIEVRPVFTERNIRNAIMMGERSDHFEDPASLEYEPVAILDINGAKSAAENIHAPFAETTMQFDPKYLKTNYALELLTGIKVWQDEVIASNESAITLPLPVSNGAVLKGKSGMRFSYKNDTTPGFVWELI